MQYDEYSILRKKWAFLRCNCPDKKVLNQKGNCLFLLSSMVGFFPIFLCFNPRQLDKHDKIWANRNKHIRVAEVERRGIPMLQRGDKFIRSSDGRIFVLKTIMKNELVLESEDGSHQIMTGKDTLMSSFKKLQGPDK
jgi:hypothetical protein